MKNKHISQKIIVFHGRTAPETGYIAGYGALIEFLKLEVPVPRQLALISEKRRKYTNNDWIVLTPRHKPEETIYDHLVFALKYEGINLLFFKKLFENLESSVVEHWITEEPLSQYSRRIWFLYEWLMETRLNVPDLEKGNYVLLIDEKLQYATPASTNSKRHRIKNNLPGTVNFCPLIHKTQTLEKYIAENLSDKTDNVIKKVHNDILYRTSAFLLLKDSKASFTIEGEKPVHSRAVRWGRAIGQAGSVPLSKKELLRLQQIVIGDNNRFVTMGYRKEAGFVGVHDRYTGEPIPDHISARWQDVETLMDGLLKTAQKMQKDTFHPVLTATNIAFGFVFIHPFVDGNGRLHRYLIHHLLATANYTPQGIIFPVSSAILEKIIDYRRVLESYSHPLLDFIKWEKASKNNIKVLNETIDYYRYFDATRQAEFLFECIDYTINQIIPEEVEYLKKYDALKNWLDDRFQMPDKTTDLLIRFLEQNEGKLSKREKNKEFKALTNSEISEIEDRFNKIFGN